MEIQATSENFARAACPTVYDMREISAAVAAWLENTEVAPSMSLESDDGASF
jgi:hypothetical protein